MRRVALGVAALAAGMLISACGGPSQATSAAIVGDQSVSLAEVQSRLTSALQRTDQVNMLAQRGVGTDDIARDVVTSTILHDLLTKQAQQQGVTVSDDAVDAAIASAGGADSLSQSTLGSGEDLRTRVRDSLLAAELGRRAVGGLSVKADIIAATSKDDAQQKATTLAKGGPDAAKLFADPRTSAKGEVFTAVTSPDDAATVLFGVPVGRVVMFQPSPQQATWLVFTVTQRITNGPSDPAAVAQISQQQLTGIGERLLQPDAVEAGIRVNPRYGVWDPIQQRVVAPDQQSGEILPAAS